jgi:hypothetical protein
MLGRISTSPHNKPGHRCRECEIGWPRGRRAQKRRENRQWRREVGNPTPEQAPSRSS